MTDTQKQIGMAGAVCAGLVNWFLNILFFRIGIGSLEYMLGQSYGDYASWIVAALFGSALLFYETNLHIDVKREGKTSLPYWAVIVVLVVINLAAGIYRSTDSVRVAKNEARLTAAQDPQYQSNLQQVQHLQANVLDDGNVGNDQGAMHEIAAIRKENSAIVARYESGAHNASGEGKWHFLFAIGFVLVNIVYGKCIGYATESGTQAQEQPAPQVQVKTQVKRKGKARRKKTQVAAQVKPAWGFAGGASSAAPQVQVAGVNKDKILADYRKQQEEGAINKTDIGRNNNCSRQYVDLVLEEFGVKQLSAKELRLQHLENYLQTNPEASLSEMAAEIGVSSRETVRKYLNELGKGPQ